MDKPKYIAEGFQEDATNLMHEFVEEGSFEFPDFARIWKKHHFSLIFMGRPDQAETSEFINEVYRISILFLSSPSYLQRIGTVYLLYALYRNQIADPPVKIRIEMRQWKIIKDLHIEAKLKMYHTLHYVIDYLIKNAFLFVANQTLKGPLMGSMQKVSKTAETISNLKTVYKSDIIEYSARSSLKTLRDLHAEYLELKKNFGSDIKVSLTNDHEVYDTFASELDQLVNPQRSKKETSESLGTRRAKIKAKSFLKSSNDLYGQPIEEDNCEVIDDPDFYGKSSKRKKGRNRRVPKNQRQIGRPSKKPKIEIPVEEKSDDDNIDISHLLNQQQDFYLPPEDDSKKIKSKPGRYYYKLSPKREECDSSGPED